jgi:serine/threonine protein phosphatase PrpC
MGAAAKSMEDADQTRTRRTVHGPARASDLRLECASLSDVGRERTENQDACGERRDGQGNLLVIVADGMGGHRGGSTASRLCIEAACREFADPSVPLGSRLHSAIGVANLEVFRAAGQDAALEGMGTTAVALALSPDGESFVGWVGDSRAYRLRGGRLQPITEDHSWIAEALRSGALTPEQAVDHPHRNQLLRCLGVSPEVEIEVRPLDVRPGDRFLLCSDGLWGEVRARRRRVVHGWRRRRSVRPLGRDQLGLGPRIPAAAALRPAAPRSALAPPPASKALEETRHPGADVTPPWALPTPDAT